MRVKKSTAWWVGIIVLVLLYIVTAAVAGEQLQFIGPAIVYAIAGTTVGFVGAQAADNGLKGANYRPELDGKP